MKNLNDCNCYFLCASSPAARVNIGFRSDSFMYFLCLEPPRPSNAVHSGICDERSPSPTLFDEDITQDKSWIKMPFPNRPKSSKFFEETTNPRILVEALNTMNRQAKTK